MGDSREGFALEQAIRHLGLHDEEVFFWAVHTGGELDILFQARVGWSSITPRLSKAQPLPIDDAPAVARPAFFQISF
jgi:hypothetical protein